jgi:hypothetical protein
LFCQVGFPENEKFVAASRTECGSRNDGEGQIIAGWDEILDEIVSCAMQPVATTQL